MTLASTSQAIAQQTELFQQLSELPDATRVEGRIGTEEAMEILGGDVSIDSVERLIEDGADLFVGDGLAILVPRGGEPIFIPETPGEPGIGYWCRIMPICDDRFR